MEGATRIDITSISVGQINWTLNATGLTWIKKSGEASGCGTGGTTGITCLGFREGHDALNNPIVANTMTSVNGYMSEQTGTSNDPYLSVTYTVPKANVPYALNTTSGGEFYIMKNSTEYKATATGDINDNKWHYLVGTYDGTTMTLYVDSVVKATNTNLTGNLPTDTGPLNIGADYQETPANFFKGNIDDVKIYNYARTADQVKADFNSKSAAVAKGASGKIGIQTTDALNNGLVGYWKLDESSGNAVDSSGNSLTLTNARSATPFSTGKFGTGANFESSNFNYLYSDDNANLSLTGSLTLATWIKPESVTASTLFTIAGKWDDTNQSYLFTQYGDELRLYIDSSSNYIETTAANLAAGTWYHVMATYNSSNQTAKIFVNAVEQATSITGTIPASIGDDAGRFHVGAQDSTGETTVSVSQSTDDAKEAAGVMNLTATTMEADATNEKLGFRFQNISIANAATVTSAFLTLYFDDATLDEPNHSVNAEAADNSSTFTTGASNITNRSLSSTTTWGVADLGAPGYFASPALSSLAQEVVNRAGWASGNAMTFIITGSATATRDFRVASQNHATYPEGQFTYDTTTATGSYYDGIIDELRLYNRALSPAEVSQLYNWAPGPVGEWKFEEGTGATLNDSTGNNNSGSWSGSTTQHYEIGKYGKGIYFNGSDDVATITNSTLNNSSFTFSVWVRTKETSAINFKIASTIGGASSAGSNVLGGQTQDATSTYFNYDTGTTALTTAIVNSDTWHYLTVVKNQSASTTSLYLNGVFQSSGDLGSNVNGASNMTLSESGANGFKGIMDQMVQYNYARTQKQIIEDMNASHPTGGSPVSSMQGYWKFDEGYDVSARSSGITQTVGTLTNMASPATINNSGWQQNGKVKGAVACDSTGTADYVDFGDLSYTESASQLTWSFWVRPNNLTTSDMILGKGNGLALTQESWGITTHSTDASQIHIGISTNTTDASNYALTPTGILTSNVWTHVIVVFDGTQSDNPGRLKAYINGKPVALSFTGTIPASTQATTSNARICSASDGAAYFSGMIDELKIYNSPLTADEVKIDYNQGSSIVMGTFSDTSNLSGGFQASSSAAAVYCIPGDTATCNPPVGEWKMEEGSWNGTSGEVKDTSGNGNNGTANGGVTTTAGKFGKAGDFSGGSDYVDAGAGAILNNLSAITASAWIYTRAPSVYNSRIFDKQSDSNTNGWKLMWSTGNRLYFQVDYDTTDLELQTATISLNAWHHIALTWDGSTSASNAHIYIDGKETTYTSPVNGSTTRADDSSYSLGLGGRVHNGPTGDIQYNGLIDEVRIFNYVRTPAQIAWDYNRGQPVGYWKMNECQGTTINDSSGNESTGTWSGTTAPHTSAGTCTTVDTATAWYNGRNGKYNASLDFDGNDDRVTVTASSKLDDLGPYSLSLWFKADTGASGYLLSKRDGGCSGPWRIDATTGAINWFKTGTGGAGNVDFEVTNAYSDNVWNHLVITWDGTIYSSGAKLYINGVQRLKTSETDAGSPLISDAGCEIYIGDRSNNTAPFEGQIDEVKIFNYILTPTQVKLDYNQGAGVRFAPLTGTP